MKRFTLIYNYKNNNQYLKVFDSVFVRNNKRKCKIIYKNKILSLTDKFQNLDEKEKLLKIELLILDTNGLNLKKMFCDCISLIKMLDMPLNGKLIRDKIDNKLLHANSPDNSIIDIDNYFNSYLLRPSTESNSIKVNNLRYMFYGCSSFVSLPDLSLWGTNQITDINNIFKDCSSLISIPDISNFKLDKVTDMNNIFCGCSSLEYLPDISNWNTYKVTNMSNIFCGCSSLISIPDIDKWNTSNVTNISGMFYECSSLKILPDISIWNIINVNDISRLFGLCKSLYYLPNISKWDLDKIDKDDDLLEGIKMINFDEGLTIIEGKNLNDKKNNYINFWNILTKKYGKREWIFLEPQDDYYNNLQEIVSKKIFDNFKCIKITYKIKENKDKIQIFSNDFIRKNKNKYKIIYKNKIYSSNKKLSISENNNKILKLKLRLFGNISIDNNNDIKGYISPLRYDEIRGYKQNINKYKIFPSNLKGLIDEYQFQIKFYENQYCQIDLDNYFSCIEPSLHTYYKLSYKNESNKGRIKILGKIFVDNNKDKSVIMYNCILLPLKEYLPIKNIQKNEKKNDNNIELLLLELENIPDKSYMFYECTSLKEFNILKNKKDIIIKDINNVKKEIYSQTDNIYNDSDENFITSSLPDMPASIEKKEDNVGDLKNFKEYLQCFIDSSNSEDNKYELTDISHMFEGCKSLLSIKGISEWNISKVTNVTSLFDQCVSLLSLPDISKWDTGNITNMSNLFNECSNLTFLPDISNWNITKVYNMNALFYGCSSLISLPYISKCDTKYCSDMNLLFFECSSLVSLPDISKWNMNLITNMMNMFDGCSSLISIPDLSKWNSNTIINLSRMFNNCKSLRSLPDISKWNTENLTNISYMFNGCSSLISLPDISKWYSNEFIDISNLFSGCGSLISLPDLSKWNFNNISNINAIFFILIFK